MFLFYLVTMKGKVESTRLVKTLLSSIFYMVRNFGQMYQSILLPLGTVFTKTPDNLNLHSKAIP